MILSGLISSCMIYFSVLYSISFCLILFYFLSFYFHYIFFNFPLLFSAHNDRLVGLVVKASASRPADPGSNSRLLRDFSGSIHTSDLKIGTPAAILPGAWRNRVSAATGWPGVGVLWLGEKESLICNFYFSVAVRTLVWADPSLRHTSILLGR